jgi:membrane protein implicated in regulation of membrane protease activity
MIEFFSDKIWLVWVLVSILCLILELGSGDLFILCFAIGALGGSLASALGGGIVVQLLSFAAVTLFSLYVFRPIALRFLHRKDEDRVSNADAIIGREGTVSQTIEEGGYGRVALDGDDWKAKSADGSAIDKGASVRIIDRDSIIITVVKR